MMSTLYEFFEIYSALICLIAGFSALLTLTVAIAIPFYIGSLPHNYFVKSSVSNKSPRIFEYRILFFQITRNLIGVILVVSGIALLLLPGQGVLTIFVGTMLLSFPGKNQLLNKFIARNKVRDTLNWIRRTQGRSPFLFD